MLPEWETEGIDPEGPLDFVTMSYSLRCESHCKVFRLDSHANSMMPDYLSLLDRIDRFLSPKGLLAVADFYVSGRENTSLSRVVGDVTSRQVGWLSRIFWQHWSVILASPTIDPSLMCTNSEGSSLITSTCILLVVSISNIALPPSSLSTLATISSYLSSSECEVYLECAATC